MTTVDRDDVDPADEEAVLAAVIRLRRAHRLEEAVKLFEEMLASPTPSMRARVLAHEFLVEFAEPEKAYAYAVAFARERSANPVAWRLLRDAARRSGRLRIVRFAEQQGKMTDDEP